MERATGKTQDCYVEFFSVHDAQAWVKVINSRGNVGNRIGDRVLDVSLSSQDELLNQLFPRAKNVAWKDGHPTFEQSNDPYNTGFKTFISAEELQVMVRHAEQPHRSTYTLKCQNRPYEAMISLLAKFPWQSTANYTLATRNKIFEAAHKMLFILNNIVRRSSSSSHGSTPSTSSMTSPVDTLYGPFSASTTPAGLPAAAMYNYPPTAGPAGMPMPVQPHKPLTPTLLQELLRASLNAQGFSESQRWALYTLISSPSIRAGFRISPICSAWPFQAVRRKERMEEDVVEFYAGVIKGHPYVAAQVQGGGGGGGGSGGRFGEVGAMIARDVEEKMSLREIGALEERVVEQILRDQCGES
ncbi:MAG: hypothetical protein OHK93_004414 [Ramalina farinacea]|uniref:Uncharacterized protein n=1 Tax=Ramalina farinacea TaxID=258253 RepID=A0AA43U1M0_9LECA|nr:hypothetical protein [Ramalina farinacea]